MFFAVDENNAKVSIDNAEPDKDYYCPICGGKLRQRRGDVRVPHFAHISACEDNWNYDMTEWHKSWQEKYPEENREVVLRNKGQTHRADVLIASNVVEFQYSPISKSEFFERNRFYNACGYKVIWLFNMRDKWDEGLISEHEKKRGIYIWKYASAIFDDFYPQGCSEVRLYFDVHCEIYENEIDYDILKINWRPPNKWNRFAADYLGEISFLNNSGLHIQYPEREYAPLPILFDRLVTLKDDFDDRVVHGCPLKSSWTADPGADCGFCEYHSYDERESQYLCTERFKDIDLNTVVGSETDEWGRVTSVVCSTNGLNETKTFSPVPCPGETVKYLWDSLAPLAVVRMRNLKTGLMVQFHENYCDPIKQIKKYNRCYGKILYPGYDNWTNNTRDVPDWDKPIWVAEWYIKHDFHGLRLSEEQGISDNSYSGQTLYPILTKYEQGKCKVKCLYNGHLYLIKGIDNHSFDSPVFSSQEIDPDTGEIINQLSNEFLHDNHNMHIWVEYA